MITCWSTWYYLCIREMTTLLYYFLVHLNPPIWWLFVSYKQSWVLNSKQLNTCLLETLSLKSFTKKEEESQASKQSTSGKLQHIKKCPHGAPPLHPAPSYVSSHQVTEELSGYSQERQSHPRPLKGFLTTQKSLTVCEQPSTMCLLKKGSGRNSLDPWAWSPKWVLGNAQSTLGLKLTPFPPSQMPTSILAADCQLLLLAAAQHALCWCQIPSSKPH